MSLGRRIRLAKNRNILKLSRLFIKHNKFLTEEEYAEISRVSKPLQLFQLRNLFGSYDEMLKELELGPLGKEVIALKPKPKPAIKKPKAPAKPRVVKPAKAKESKDE